MNYFPNASEHSFRLKASLPTYSAAHFELNNDAGGALLAAAKAQAKEDVRRKKMYEPPMTSSQRPQPARSHVGSVPAAWSAKMRGARISLCWRLLVGSSQLLKSNRRNRRKRRVILVDFV